MLECWALGWWWNHVKPNFCMAKSELLWLHFNNIIIRSTPIMFLQFHAWLLKSQVSVANYAAISQLLLNASPRWLNLHCWKKIQILVEIGVLNCPASPEACPSGSFSSPLRDGKGLTSVCLSCAPGSVQSSGASTACEPCPLGQHQEASWKRIWMGNNGDIVGILSYKLMINQFLGDFVSIYQFSIILIPSISRKCPRAWGGPLVGISTNQFFRIS